MKGPTISIYSALLALIVPTLAWTGSEPTSCDCAALAASNVHCYQVLWSRFASSSPKTVDELSALLDAMWEGTPEGEEAAHDDCTAGPSDTCEDQCMLTLWRSFVDLANNTTKPHERWGALTLAFGAFMDVGAEAEELSVLEGIARDFLSKPRDPLSTATTLRMMMFYEFPPEPLNSQLLALMESESTLQRELAYQRFSQYTRCNLVFHPEADSKKRGREIAKIRRWWSNERHAAATKGEDHD